jgi:hypothetical protein
MPVRAVGRFLEDPLDVPWQAVEFAAAGCDEVWATSQLAQLWPSLVDDWQSVFRPLRAGPS